MQSVYEFHVSLPESIRVTNLLFVGRDVKAEASSLAASLSCPVTTYSPGDALPESDPFDLVVLYFLGADLSETMRAIRPLCTPDAVVYCAEDGDFEGVVALPLLTCHVYAVVPHGRTRYLVKPFGSGSIGAFTLQTPYFYPRGGDFAFWNRIRAVIADQVERERAPLDEVVKNAALALVLHRESEMYSRL